VDSSGLFGGIEGGGTKFICAVGTGTGTIINEVRVATSTPAATLQEVISYFRPFCKPHEVEAIGIGCFGPVDLEPESSTYGFITSTPKPGWQNTDVVGTIRAALPVKVAFDLDVNAAALGEHAWGAAAPTDPSLYLTIGTGIGGTYLQQGKALRGLLHPEMGHIRVPHDLDRDHFSGSCPFHGDCFEGLASGPAIQRRFGLAPEHLTDNDPFWDLEAGYIASALVAYILILSPRRVILGGGVMKRAFLFPEIRVRVLEMLRSYLRSPALEDHIDSYIVPPALGTRSGVLGALVMARDCA
jgi:fructokinase